MRSVLPPMDSFNHAAARQGIALEHLLQRLLHGTLLSSQSRSSPQTPQERFLIPILSTPDLLSRLPDPHHDLWHVQAFCPLGTPKTDLVLLLSPIQSHGFKDSSFIYTFTIKSFQSQSLASQHHSPAHHMARIRLDDFAHPLWPQNPEHQGWILEHFLDGNSLGHRSPQEQTLLAQHFQSVWPTLAVWSLTGRSLDSTEPLSFHTPSHLLLIEQSSDTLCVASLCIAHMDLPAFFQQFPVQFSANAQTVGIIHNQLQSLQRGQALSMGVQRDIQVKWNIPALRSFFNPPSVLFSPPLSSELTR